MTLGRATGGCSSNFFFKLRALKLHFQHSANTFSVQRDLLPKLRLCLNCQSISNLGMALNLLYRNY